MSNDDLHRIKAAWNNWIDVVDRYDLKIERRDGGHFFPNLPEQLKARRSEWEDDKAS